MKTTITAIALTALLSTPAFATIENGVEGENREHTTWSNSEEPGTLIENGVQGENREDTQHPDFNFGTIIEGLLWVLRV